MILTTSVARGSSGSSSAQQRLECRQGHRNPMQSRSASDSAGVRPETNLATAKMSLSQTMRQKTTSWQNVAFARKRYTLSAPAPIFKTASDNHLLCDKTEQATRKMSVSKKPPKRTNCQAPSGRSLRLLASETCAARSAHRCCPPLGTTVQAGPMIPTVSFGLSTRGQSS
jgi:hypothetical protein